MRKKENSRMPLWLAIASLVCVAADQTLPSAHAYTALSVPTLQCTSSPELGFLTQCNATPALKMPEDYGTHLAQEREWWYYIGNGFTDQGKRVGFMFSVTRELGIYVAGITVMGEGVPQGYWQTTMIALSPSIQTGDIFEMALSDLFKNEARFVHSYSKKTLQVEAKIKNGSKKISIAFTANITKPGVLHGFAGYSQKHLTDPRIASLYFSETRMDILPNNTPIIQLNDTPITLKQGNVYHDHEISNSVKGSTQDFVGWDWIGMQFFDKTEVVGFQMRKSNATPFTYSAKSLTEVSEDGSYKTSALTPEFEMKPLGTMKLRSGVTYPSSFEVRVKDKTYYAVPLVQEAELIHFANLYGWFEGSINIYSDAAHTQLVGWGFLEMTGYGKSSLAEYRKPYAAHELSNMSF